MAMVKAETVAGFQRLPALRQLGLMIGLAASVAVGVAVVLWSQKPNYTLLYANLGSKDAGQVVEALQKAGIAYEVDQTTGAVMVESSKIQNARMQLASDGLPEGTATGFEMLQEDQGFGTSQFIETARFQHALESELGRTIATLKGVESARVHLAIPKRSAFLRERANPTASVMLHLYSGRRLGDEQISAIIHLVSSSVPHLAAEKVTLADQHGKLLSNGGNDTGASGTSSQFSYNRKLESTYVERIRQLLEPIVGAGRVRATVNASLDFTVTERTRESYNPDLPALRSEQTSEERSADASGPSGVPGALSNQPPEAGSLADPQNPDPTQAAAPAMPPSGRSSKRSVRNYELDKTVSHTRLASGSIRRLSIAVVIDDKQAVDDNDEPVSAAWSDVELIRFTTLVKEVVGFDAQRGDSINMINSSFVPLPDAEPMPEPGLLQQPWVSNVARQAAGALGLLVVVFGVLKPVMRSLAVKGAQPLPAGTAMVAVGADGVPLAAAEDQLSLSGASPQQAQLEAPRGGYQQNLEKARGVVSEDPKRVAQVVKNWVNEDG